MHAATLPGGTEKHRTDRGFQPFVGVGNDQLDPGQAASSQAAQEAGPERLVLTVTNIHAEDFTFAISSDTDGGDHRLGHEAMVQAGFAAGGIEKHVGVAVGA